MSDTNIRNYLRERLRRDFLLGKMTGLPKIPTSAELELAIDRVLLASDNGIIGDTTSVGKKSVSDPDVYGKNFTTVKDNIEYLLGDVQNVVNSVIDSINNSTTEKNSAVRELRMAAGAFDEIEAGRLTDDGISYVVSDSFNDISKIDLERTTADINLNAGTVAIKLAAANQLQFSHYRKLKTMRMNVTEGKSFIVSETQLPETSFGDIFDSDYTDRWEYVITTSEPTKVTTYFTVKLSEVGDAVEINEVLLKLSSVQASDLAGVMYLEYLSTAKDDRNWYRIPGGLSDLSSNEIDLKFSPLQTTHLRFTFTKEWPDVPEKNEYHYGIIELIVKKAATAYESLLVSKPLEVESYHREDVSIFSTMISVDQVKQPGATVKYYIGIDEPIAGKIVNSASTRVDIDSTDAYEFVANGTDSAGDTENYYTYASQLRDHPWISGAATFATWEPAWQEITPINDRSPSIPTTRFFNTSVINQKNHDLSFLTPYTFGDASYTGPWPAATYTGTWADDWDGTAAGAPKSGYIWGESPFTVAGIWWGDGVEVPGWWRPHLPDETWTQTWEETSKYSSPDFCVPIYDAEGRPVFALNKDTGGMEPVQNKFWKIFKWPKTFLPIPGSIKLYSEMSDEAGQAITDDTNKQSWKWNYKSKRGVQDYSLTFAVKEGAYFHTLKIEELIEDTSELQIVKDGVTNLRFKNFTPSLVEDYFVDYGYDYITNEAGLTQRQSPEPAFIDAHATLVFKEAMLTYQTVTGDRTPEMSVDFKYMSRDAVEASWESLIYVPDETPVGISRGHITDVSGFVRKLLVDSMDEYGIITRSREILPGQDMQDFPIDLGWTKVRIFVDVDLTQTGNTSNTIAKWSPSDLFIFQDNDTVIMEGVNNDQTLRDQVKVTGLNFTASGLVPGVHIDLFTQPNVLTEDAVIVEGLITKIDGDLLNVIALDGTTGMLITRWEITQFTKKSGFTHENVEMGSKLKPMQQVDLYTLMHETAPDNDNRFAIVEDVDEDQYAVVKTPHADHFPKEVLNRKHYTRTYFDTATSAYVTFTTGTEGNVGGHPRVALDSLVDWNTPFSMFKHIPYLDDRPPNSNSSTAYANISTYGQPLQVTNPGASGFLFWDTGENLQCYYRIEYSLPLNSRPNNRVFLMAALTADKANVTPVLKSYNLIVNSKEDERRGL